jgi:hypothetical protein
MSCPKCRGTGVIETGNNDLPCDCPAGDTAKFNVAGMPHPVDGAYLKREHSRRTDFIREQTRIPPPPASECQLCGIDGEHSKERCEDQRSKNAANIARKLGCRWCGSAVHAENCPKYKKDQVSVRREGRTTVVVTECGYCHEKTETSHTEADERGFGGAASLGGIQHRIGCPKFVTVLC